MIDKVEIPGKEMFSPAKRIGELLTEQFKKDPHFYFFSPDETTSNKFDKIFEVEKRAWGLEQQPWDLPESKGGRIVEMLSENVLFLFLLNFQISLSPFQKIFKSSVFHLSLVSILKFGVFLCLLFKNFYAPE